MIIIYRQVKPIEDLYNIQSCKMMMNSRAMTTLQNQRFRTKLEQCYPNYAYEVLLLEIVVEDDMYPRKPTIEEIARLIQLYMHAVEVLESASDCRYDYFKRKIHALMLKKNVVEQMHLASGQTMTKKTAEQCERAELEKRKYQHEAQIYFNKTDNNKVQQILRKADLQVRALNSNLKNNIISQEQKLEQRIKHRKMKSETGSLYKYRLGSHNAHAKGQDTPPRRNDKMDPRMDYFNDYQDSKPAMKNAYTPKNSGSVEKKDIVKRSKDYPI